MVGCSIASATMTFTEPQDGAGEALIMPRRRTRSATDWLYILRDGAMAIAGVFGVVVAVIVSLPNLLGDWLAHLLFPRDEDDRR